MKNQIVEKIFHVEDGDILFKNTEMKDKEKGFFMRIINEITTGWTNFRRWLKGQPRIKGMDHTEFMMWDGTTLEVHSSVNGTGVRSQNYMRWVHREGSPEIVLLRRAERITPEEKVTIHSMIKRDRGIPYALSTAIKYGITKRTEAYTPEESELMDRGLFCVEATLRFSLVEKYGGMWPDEAYEYLVKNGYYVVYEGNSRDLIQM